MVKKYGQTVLVTQDLALENYLDRWVPPRTPPRTDPNPPPKNPETAQQCVTGRLVSRTAHDARMQSGS
jgi:hypothetical protein